MGVPEWLRLKGDSPGERVRRNPLQLIALVVVVWMLAIGVYMSLEPLFGELVTALVMILGGVLVALHLRDLLVEADPSVEE